MIKVKIIIQPAGRVNLYTAIIKCHQIDACLWDYDKMGIESKVESILYIFDERNISFEYFNKINFVDT